MRAGELAKPEILGRIRYSAEGRAAGVHVRGLALPFVIRNLQRVPILGRLFGIGFYLLRLPHLARNYERFEADYFQRRVETIRQINAASGLIEGGLGELWRTVGTADADMRAAIEQLRNDTATTARATALERAVEALDREKAERCDLADLAGLLAKKAEEEQVSGLQKWMGAVCQDLAAVGVQLGQTQRLLRDTQQQLGAAQQQLADTRADHAALVALAATRADVRNLEAAVALTAAQADLNAIGQELVALTGQVVRRNEVEPRFVGIERALEFKADGERLTNLTNRIVEQLQLLPARGELDSLAATLRQEFRSRSEVPGAGDQCSAEPGGLDAFYAAFEDRFRGTIDDIRARVAAYLPTVRGVGAGAVNAPILDVGCGRGEWLDVLRECGLRASGVDINGVTIDACRARGLEVTRSDAIDHLRTLATGSIGAVTALHVIEHLPFRRLIVLFDEAFRVLMPGGVAIFETPNPENLLVGACTFYYDPTHVRPLPPEPTQFVAESRGFVDTSILRIHEAPVKQLLGDGAPAVRSLLNELLYGARDYALIGYKPKL
jgi:SAM-dependent methyltransferase